MPLLLHSCCPKPVQISGLGTGTQLSYAQISQTADWETNIQSGLLLRSGTSGNALRCHIISAVLWLYYLQTHCTLGFCVTVSECGVPLQQLCTPSVVSIFIRACHLSQSSTTLIQSLPTQPISLKSILILSSHPCPCLLSVLFPSSFTCIYLGECSIYCIL